MRVRSVDRRDFLKWSALAMVTAGGGLAAGNNRRVLA
jgi:hypothetical protein